MRRKVCIDIIYGTVISGAIGDFYRKLLYPFNVFPFVPDISTSIYLLSQP